MEPTQIIGIKWTLKIEKVKNKLYAIIFNNTTKEVYKEEYDFTIDFFETANNNLLKVSQ